MSSHATVTSKGQVTIPKAIREKLALQAGDEILFEETPAGIMVSRAPGEPIFKKWVGFLDHLEGEDPDQLVREMRGL